MSGIEEDCEQEESFLIDDVPHKLRDVVKKYCKSVEHKSLDPDGSKCASDTMGLLRRRPIRASGVFHWIGREVDRGTSTDSEYYSDEPLTKYGKIGYRFPEALRRYSSFELARRTGLSEKTIREARKNKLQPRAKTATRVLWYARVISHG